MPSGYRKTYSQVVQDSKEVVEGEEREAVDDKIGGEDETDSDERADG